MQLSDLKRPATQKNAANDISTNFIKRNQTPSIFMKRHTNSPKIRNVNFKKQWNKIFHISECYKLSNYKISPGGCNTQYGKYSNICIVYLKVAKRVDLKNS